MNTFSTRIKILLALIFACTATLAFAADPPDDDVPADWCAVSSNAADGDPDYPDVPPGTVVDRSGCSRTAKKYRIADNSNEVCHIKTCCKVIWDSIAKRWRTVCKDTYVNCETIIIE